MVFAVVAILPIGILFFVSGFIVNLIQVVLFIFVRPVSKNVFRRINKIVSELLLLELIWLVDWWGNLKIELYADDDALELMGQEHALVICNHRSDIDWLVGLTIAQRTGCLGSTLALIKKEARFLPIIGWSMWFSGYVFLERNWAKDEETLKSGFKQLEDFPMPFWLALFVEGTRFTQEKLQVAQEFASSRGLPIPRNVLIPRTKGFVAAVTHLRSFVPVIYDCTVAVPKAHPAPTLLRIFARKSSVIKFQIKRHSMEELPATTDGIAQWCKEVFVNKDAMLDVYNAKNIFGEEKLQDNGCYIMVNPPPLRYCQVIPMLVYPGLMGSYFIFCRSIGPCNDCYAYSHPIIRVRTFYASIQVSMFRRTKGETSSSMKCREKACYLLLRVGNNVAS
ncbi:hypothetical protein K2173_022110 [Erythroxylum novogranatense]|uniref:1-acylglycerol-3-phosphate O-acyltransferase n=1 Tax=Erythroxylum novogranatense TaxID=1862640 RepID=A0AAV8TVQ2_9ROSI|nr:hypothetical protein K2173_022110 [Erythroxylum novogranatense]